MAGRLLERQAGTSNCNCETLPLLFQPVTSDAMVLRPQDLLTRSESGLLTSFKVSDWCFYKSDVKVRCLMSGAHRYGVAGH